MSVAVQNCTSSTITRNDSDSCLDVRTFIDRMVVCREYNSEILAMDRTLDHIDAAILNVLQDNARTTQADIAKAVGLAPSAVLERMRKLEARGVIREYVAAVDPHAANRALLAFVAVRTNEFGPEQPAARALASIPEVLEIHHVAGEDCYLLKVRAKDAEHLGHLLRLQIGVVPGRDVDAHDNRARDREGDLAHSDRSGTPQGTASGGVMSRHERKLAYARLDRRLLRLGHDVSRDSCCARVRAGRAAGRASLGRRRRVARRRCCRCSASGCRIQDRGARLRCAGFLMAVIGNGGVVWAEQYVASGLAAVVVAMVPFWTVLIEAALPRGERLTSRTLMGLGIGFLGIVVLVWPELTIGGDEGRMFFAGVVALQIACLGWALGTSYTKRNAINGEPARRVGHADAVERRHVDCDRHGDWRVEPPDVYRSNRRRDDLSGAVRIDRRLFGVRLRAEVSADFDRIALRVRQPDHRGDPGHVVAVGSLLAADCAGLSVGLRRHCRGALDAQGGRDGRDGR